MIRVQVGRRWRKGLSAEMVAAVAKRNRTLDSIGQMTRKALTAGKDRQTGRQGFRFHRRRAQWTKQCGCCPGSSPGDLQSNIKEQYVRQQKQEDRLQLLRRKVHVAGVPLREFPGRVHASDRLVRRVDGRVDQLPWAGDPHGQRDQRQCDQLLLPAARP